MIGLKKPPFWPLEARRVADAWSWAWRDSLWIPNLRPVGSQVPPIYYGRSHPAVRRATLTTVNGTPDGPVGTPLGLATYFDSTTPEMVHGAVTAYDVTQPHTLILVYSWKGTQNNVSMPFGLYGDQVDQEWSAFQSREGAGTAANGLSFWIRNGATAVRVGTGITSSFWDDRPHLVIGTTDATVAGTRFWLDGVEYTTVTAGSAIPGSTPTDYLSIGARRWGTTPNQDLGQTGDFLLAGILFGQTITDGQVAQLAKDWFGPFRRPRRTWQLAPVGGLSLVQVTNEAVQPYRRRLVVAG